MSLVYQKEEIKMRKKTDWLVAIVCSEIIAAGLIVITMLGYYFWRIFL